MNVYEAFQPRFKVGDRVRAHGKGEGFVYHIWFERNTGWKYEVVRETTGRAYEAAQDNLRRVLPVYNSRGGAK